MRSRIFVAAVGVPILLYIVLLGPGWLIAAALAFLAGVGGMELQQCVSGGKVNRVMLCASVAIPVMVVYWYFMNLQHLDTLFLLCALPVFLYAVYLGGAARFEQIAAALFGGVAIGYAFSSFLRIYASGLHRGYLLLPFVLSFACDTFAYFTGLTIGKHKLAPKVSPHKTVEGAVGGLVGNVLCGLIFTFVMNRWFEGTIGYTVMAVLALFCGVVAQIGDLSFSLIKREFGVKDYGKLFLAHGGVLDRFDSVLFVAPVLAAMMQIMRIAQIG